MVTLLAFHRSIRAALGVFDEIASLASAGVVDVIKASALYDFFRGPMQWHDDDEGKSLLPRLLKADPARLRALVEQCQAEHDRMDAAVAAVLLHLHEISVGAAEPDQALLRSTALELRRVLEPHLVREERHIFPAALELLTPADFDAIALEMHASRLRRWVAISGPPR